MDLNANVKGMCHIANFLDLADAAAVADIRLCKLEQVFSKITCILPAGKETLSIGNGNLCIFCDILHGLRSRGIPVSYTHLRAHETGRNLVCRLLLEKKKKKYKSTSPRDSRMCQTNETYKREIRSI